MQNPQQFLLDPVGKCTSCSQSPQANETVKCATCKEFFHALCETATDNNFICLKSFLKNWHSPSVKSNFEWNCDVCKTKKEENEVFTTENKFDQLFSLIKNLGDNITEMKNDFNKDISSVKSTVAELSSGVNALRDSPIQQIPSINTPHPSPWANKEKVQSMRSSLVLKNKDGSTTEVDKTAQLAKLKTLAVCNEIPVARVGFDSSGNTYIDCPTSEDIDKLQPLLTEDFKDKQVSVLKDKLPCISIVGIEDEVTKSNLLNKVCKQNPAVNSLVNDGEAFTVLFVKSMSNGTFTAVARVSPKIRNAIRSGRNRIFLGVTSCKVFDRFHVKRCNKCQQYGHYKADCTSNVPCCAYCSENHDTETCHLKECRDTSKFSCVNCKSKGLQHTGHAAFSYSCPTYIAAQNRLRKTIPYYDNTSGKRRLNN